MSDEGHSFKQKKNFAAGFYSGVVRRFRLGIENAFNAVGGAGAERGSSLCGNNGRFDGKHCAAEKYIATVEAINSVDVKAQVTGYLDKILFREGGFVKKTRCCLLSNKAGIKRR